MGTTTDLVEIDDWLPELVLLLMEVSHTNFTEVTWMVFVHVRSMMMRTTSKTTTTGMLPVLACCKWSVCVSSYTIRVFFAYLHDHDRQRHGHGASASSFSWSAL